MIPITCFQCMRDDVSAGDIIAALEFRNDGRYEITCPKGHKSVTVLQQQKFEILFEIGAYAINDGYFREAVSSFTSSLERFYEFFMRAVLFDKGMEADIFKQAWKLVERQSPRQLGAFVFLYLSEYGSPPPLLNRTKLDFRDEVTHQGRIPTREEAVDYGQAVLNVVRPVLKQVTSKYSSGVQKTVFQHIHDCHLGADEVYPVSHLCMPTILSLSVAEPGYEVRSLEEALINLKRMKQRLRNIQTPPLR